MTVEERLSVLLFPVSCQNFGHCLFDGFFPAFAGMHAMDAFRGKDPMKEPFRMVEYPFVTPGLKHFHRHKAILEKFSGSPSLDLESIPPQVSSTVHFLRKKIHPSA